MLFLFELSLLWSALIAHIHAVLLPFFDQNVRNMNSIRMKSFRMKHTLLDKVVDI